MIWKVSTGVPNLCCILGTDNRTKHRKSRSKNNKIDNSGGGNTNSINSGSSSSGSFDSISSKEFCEVCHDALNSPTGKNKRDNVSIALNFTDSRNEKRTIVIDVGKTMRNAFLQHRHYLHRVDAILLTHGHADAILGLDDVRDLQNFESVKVNDEVGLKVWWNLI